MRSIRSTGAALTLAGIASLAVAAPAFAGTPLVSVNPSVAAPGSSVTAYIYCGSTSATEAAVDASAFGFTQGVPMQPSTHKGSFVTTITVPASTKAGVYTLKMGCNNHAQGSATLTVKSSTVVPNTGPMTGDGITSTAVGGPLTAAGILVVGLSGVAGTLAFRRRRVSAGK